MKSLPWPYYLFSIPLDLLTRAIKRLAEWSRRFYENLARRFMVRA